MFYIQVKVNAWFNESETEVETEYHNYIYIWQSHVTKPGTTLMS